MNKHGESKHAEDGTEWAAFFQKELRVVVEAAVMRALGCDNYHMQQNLLSQVAETHTLFSLYVSSDCSQKPNRGAQA